MVLAKEDGYLLVYDEAGELVHSELVGEPIRAVASVASGSGGRLVAAALPGRIVAFDLTGKRQWVVVEGEYTRLLSPGDEGRLVALGDGAIVEAFDVGQAG